VRFSCSEACDAVLTLKLNGRVAGRAAVHRTSAGRATVRLKLRRGTTAGPRARASLLAVVSPQAGGANVTLRRAVRLA
jgi:hypothetical protein